MPPTYCLLDGFINSSCSVVSVIQKHLWAAEWRSFYQGTYCWKLSPCGCAGQMTPQSSRIVLVVGNCAFEGLVNHACYLHFLGKTRKVSLGSAQNTVQQGSNINKQLIPTVLSNGQRTAVSTDVTFKWNVSFMSEIATIFCTIFLPVLYTLKHFLIY